MNSTDIENLLYPRSIGAAPTKEGNTSADEQLRTNHIEDSGPLVNIGHLPVFDDLMLDVLAWTAIENEEMFSEDRGRLDRDGRTFDYGGDRPTELGDSWVGEAQAGWHRKNPRARGDEHAFDMDYVGVSDDACKLDTPSARGAFLGCTSGERLRARVPAVVASAGP